MSQQPFSLFSPISAEALTSTKSPDDSTMDTSKRTPRRKLLLDDSLQSPTVDSAYGTSSESVFTFSFSESNDRRHSLASTYSDKENVTSDDTPHRNKSRPLSFSSFPLSTLSSNFAPKPLMKHISSPLERMTLASPNSCSSDGYFSDVFDNIGGEDASKEMPHSFSSLFVAPITSTCNNKKSPVSRRGSIKRSLLDIGIDERQSKKTPPHSPATLPPYSPPSSQNKLLKGVALFRSQSVCVPPPPCENAMFPDSPGDGCVERIGDHSKPYLLPLTQGTVPDLKCITPDTVEGLLKGEYLLTKYLIVDCRYPYEYQAGHIKGAVNIWEKDLLLGKFFSSPVHPCDERDIIIFHCEFSSKRAPDMNRFMRKIDREKNGMDFPKLFYPELYLIEGGYKGLFRTHSHLCEPQNYMTMLDTKHKGDLLHFSKRSKSWSGSNNPTGRRLRHRHSLHDVIH